MRKPSKDKKPVDIGRMILIQNSFLALKFAKEYKPIDFLEAISPLMKALERNEHDLIAASIPNKPMSDRAKMKLQTMIFVFNMISEPKNVLGFEIELTKNDVLHIMEEVFAPLYKFIPTSTSTRTKWWKPIDLGLKTIGLRVEQNRLWNPNPDLEKWIKTRKIGIDLGALDFAPNGEPMEGGEPLFLSFPNDLSAYL
jgi:hypothetical protein